MSIEREIEWLTSAARDVRWLVGVSGGGDSVALLHLLAESGFTELVICHLNHGLRGAESLEDERFVRTLAESLSLPCEIEQRDIREMTRPGAGSMETVARRERHEFFARCALRQGCPRLLLGHQADDQAETVLWNLVRGSHGLRGMREEQALVVGGVELRLVRPLLGLRHDALLEWLRVRGHGWREDASNREPVAVRNRLRHEVLPLLAEICGRDPVPALVRGAADELEREGFEAGVLAGVKWMDPQGRVFLPAFRRLPLVMRRLALRKFLGDAGVADVDRGVLDRGCALADVSGPAAVNLPGGRRLRRRAGRLWIDG